MNDVRAEKAHERMACAEHAIEAARLLAAAGQSEAAINRAYYAAFYAASALLVARDLESSKHQGIISLFDREFVLPGLVDRKHGSALHNLFHQRSVADYAFFVEFGEDAVEVIVNSAADFIEAAERLLPSLLQDE